MGTPADVVKARIMNQPTDKSGRGECVRRSKDVIDTQENVQGDTGGREHGLS